MFLACTRASVVSKGTSLQYYTRSQRVFGCNSIRNCHDAATARKITKNWKQAQRQKERYLAKGKNHHLWPREFTKFMPSIKDYKFATLEFNKLQKRGIANCECYNTMLSETTRNCLFHGYVKRRNKDGSPAIQDTPVVAFMKEFEKNGVKPDVTTFNILVDFYARSDSPQEFLKYYKSILSASMKPTILTFTSIIDYYTKKYNWIKVDFWLDEMFKYGIKKDGYVYSILFRGYGGSVHSNRFNTLLKELKRDKNFTPNSHVFTEILKGFIKRGQDSKIPGLIEEIKKAGFYPNIAVITVLARYYSRKESVKDLDKLLKDVKEAKDFSPNRWFLNVMIRSYNTLGEVDKEKETMEYLHSLGFEDVDRKTRISLSNTEILDTVPPLGDEYHDYTSKLRQKKYNKIYIDDETTSSAPTKNMESPIGVRDFIDLLNEEGDEIKDSESTPRKTDFSAL